MIPGFTLPPIHREGWPFIGLFALLALGLWLFAAEWLGFIGLVLTAWCCYFFRDPARTTPVREGLVISPADGVVTLIEPAVPPEELGVGSTPRLRVSVFMNVFDCHVNRAALPGQVVKLAYRAGAFLNASLDKASELNERMSWRIQTASGQDVILVQIAGLVARRIVAFAREGDQLEVGQRFGMIRFGSRVDVYLPDGVAPLVAVGQRAIAGETVIADLAASEPARTGRTA